MNYTILLIEDDPWLGELYSDILQNESNATVLVCNSAEKALLAINADTVDLIMLDMVLGEHNGIEFLHEIASYSDSNVIPVIVLSSIYQHDFKMTRKRWLHYGVCNYLYKPDTKPADLVVAVKKQLAYPAGEL